MKRGDYTNLISALCLMVLSGHLLSAHSSYPIFSYTSADSTMLALGSPCISSVQQQQILTCEGKPYVIGQSQYYESGFYSDTLSTFLGCDSIVNTELVFLQDNEILPNDTTLCIGEQVYIDLSDMEYDLMFWSDLFAVPFISIEKTGMHWVDIFKGDCHWSDTLSVVFHEEPPASMDTTLCYGQELHLPMGRVGGVIAWDHGFSNEDILVSNDTILQAQIENVCGSFDFSAEVDFYECDVPIKIPLSFSPDGDGIGDELRIIHEGELADFQLTIFDRAYHKVYETTEVDCTWDGTTSCSPAPASNYYWLLEYAILTPGGSFAQGTERGQVNLIRKRSAVQALPN